MTDVTVTEVEVPAIVHDLRLFDRVDYEDAFRVPADDARTPEQWLRGFLHDAPRWFLVSWLGLGTGLLGARLGSLRSREHVLGWKVLRDEPEVFVIGLESIAGLSARLIATTPPGEAVISTQIRLRTAWARTLWSAIRPAHRHFAALLLERTAQRGRPGRSVSASA